MSKIDFLGASTRNKLANYLFCLVVLFLRRRLLPILLQHVYYSYRTIDGYTLYGMLHIFKFSITCPNITRISQSTRKEISIGFALQKLFLEEDHDLIYFLQEQKAESLSVLALFNGALSFHIFRNPEKCFLAGLGFFISFFFVLGVFCFFSFCHVAFINCH